MTRSAAVSLTPVTGDARGARSAVRGLYAITPDERDTAVLTAKVNLAIKGGARLVQYRNKSADAALRKQQAAALLALCRDDRVPLIVNDDLDLAIELGADGVHLGRGDAGLAGARRRLAAGKLLGASCYDDLDAALAAVEQGADYVAFGAAFPTAVKPGAPRAPLALYAAARARLGVPIVAIGGITPQNAASVVAAGADAVAVITALFDAPDIEQRAREFSGVLR
jgi:thiamine-phosphate pyrophosphorylase